MVGSFLIAAALAQAAGDLPEGNAFVRGLIGAQKRHEEAQNRYTYDELEVREELDGKGAVKKRRSRLYETFHVKGRPVRKLTAENDLPLSPQRRSEVEREVAQKVEAILKGGTVAERPGVRLSAILERYDFRAVAREEMDGQAVLALEFAPRPGNRALDHDSMLRQLTGRIWVDEAERQIVRAHIRNLEPVKFALGIGGKLSHVDLDLRFRKLEDGVWLPREIRGDFQGRKLFSSFHIRNTQTFERYRVFEVQSQEELKPGS
ncbi:MAG: hypothetical protein ABW221_28285 [Vicinamibacteria bacterium]